MSERKLPPSQHRETLTVRTATHPASTSHGRLTEQRRLAAGIRRNLPRVAVGLDPIEDLKADLARGLDTL